MGTAGNFLLVVAERSHRDRGRVLQPVPRFRCAIAWTVLDDQAPAAGTDFSLRQALAHLIDETTRHCGHLVLLREGID